MSLQTFSSSVNIGYELKLAGDPFTSVPKLTFRNLAEMMTKSIRNMSRFLFL